MAAAALAAVPWNRLLASTLSSRTASSGLDSSSCAQNEAQREHVETLQLLCLSNGHGEDTIAVSVLQELQKLAKEKRQAIHISALPLVGEGTAYLRAGMPIVGPTKAMPSGGFLYMDQKQLLGDVQAGLLALTVGQVRPHDQHLPACA
eukprot:SM000011S19016  [mRNA]  locus=s11:350416:351346:- [translate_table: standard]